MLSLIFHVKADIIESFGQKEFTAKMRMRKKKWAVPELLSCGFYIELPQEYKGRWKEAFPRPELPIYLELGCGKGSFAAQMGIRYPDINFLAIDLISDMLGVGQRNIKKLYAEHQREIGNIRLVAPDIERLSLIMDEHDQFDRMFINFCNPWPKAKHRKKRLTHPKQLMSYREHLKDGGEIWFKTDCGPLFQDSLTYFEEAGFTILYQTKDLHHSDFEGFSPMTEHEAMFTSQGIPTKFLIARKSELIPKNAD